MNILEGHEQRAAHKAAQRALKYCWQAWDAMQMYPLDTHRRGLDETIQHLLYIIAAVERTGYAKDKDKEGDE